MIGDPVGSGVGEDIAERVLTAQLLSTPVVAMCGTRDPEVTYADILAWQDHTTESLRVRMLAGDHHLRANGTVADQAPGGW